MKYVNLRTGEIASVVETNKKFKTVILEYESGKTENVCTSTLKKQYNVVADQK